MSDEYHTVLGDKMRAEAHANNLGDLLAKREEELDQLKARSKWAAVALDGSVVCLHCGRGCKDASYPQGTCDECESLSALPQPETRECPTNHGVIVERDPVSIGGENFTLGTHMPHKTPFCPDCGQPLPAQPEREGE